MSKKIMTAVFSAVLMFIITTVNAEDPKVSVNLSANELAFSLNILNTIDIVGEEVGPFLDVKNLLTSSYKDASSSKKGATDVNFPLPMAKNFVFFIQRAKLKGADATIFYDLSKKVVDSIKKVSSK
jgi:hypothetical protein